MQEGRGTQLLAGLAWPGGSLIEIFFKYRVSHCTDLAVYYLGGRTILFSMLYYTLLTFEIKTVINFFNASLNHLVSFHSLQKY